MSFDGFSASVAYVAAQFLKTPGHKNKPKGAIRTVFVSKYDGRALSN